MKKVRETKLRTDVLTAYSLGRREGETTSKKDLGYYSAKVVKMERKKFSSNASNAFQLYKPAKENTIYLLDYKYIAYYI